MLPIILLLFILIAYAHFKIVFSEFVLQNYLETIHLINEYFLMSFLILITCFMFLSLITSLEAVKQVSKSFQLYEKFNKTLKLSTVVHNKLLLIVIYLITIVLSIFNNETATINFYYFILPLLILLQSLVTGFFSAAKVFEKAKQLSKENKFTI